MTAINQYNKCDGFTKYVNKMNNNQMNGSCGAVYIGTNEEGRQETFDCLATSTAKPNACHIGFSSWFNFDIIVKRKSSRAILIDFNPNTKSFLLETLNCVITSDNRSVFSDKMYNYIKNNEGKFSINCSEGIEGRVYENSLEVADEVYCESKIPGNWLNTDEGFNYIKKLASEGKISVITEDIGSHEKFKRISNIIDENGYSIDTLYVSNISKYMSSKESKENFVKSVNHLSGAETKIIHCVPWNLEQKVIEVEKLSDVDAEGRKVNKNLLFSNFLDAYCSRKGFKGFGQQYNF